MRTVILMSLVINVLGIVKNVIAKWQKEIDL